MAGRRTLELKTKQRQELEEYRDHDTRPYMRERCGALLKIAGARPRTPWRGRACSSRGTPTRSTGGYEYMKRRG